jgi:DNA-binding transcriptional LysR family regulator
VEGAHQCSVPDHAMKKEVILQGMAWGHLPRFMIEDELRDGSLVPIAGRYLPGSTEDVAAARRLDRQPGPVAARLWDTLQQQAVTLRRSYK